MAQRHWHELIAPWLTRNGNLLAARHLLHRGLKSVPDNSLLQPALAWLESNGRFPVASFVLAPLLGWDAGRLGEDQPTVLAAALRWLGDDNNASAPEAGFVLPPLLGWDAGRLGKDHQPTVLAAALRWLEVESNATAPEARFVLHPLLGWEAGRLGEDQPTVLAAALRWLKVEGNATAPEAGFVLPPLLRWPSLPAQTRRHCANLAVGWLDRYPERDDATHVLKSLLQAANAFPDEVEINRVLSSAADWLDAHAKHPERSFVIARLLRIRRLPHDVWELLAHAGLDLLENNREGRTDDYLLNSIVARLRTLSGSDQTRLANLAARWIGCTENPRDVISLLDNCRTFLPEEHLARIRPTLEAANRQRRFSAL